LLPFPLGVIETLNDDRHRLMLAEMRRGSHGEHVCSDFGVNDRRYVIQTRYQWGCK
jgi:hypothetical protein